MSGTADDVFVAAGEFVLGVLGRAEQLESEARRTSDRDFADAVAYWEDRLTPLCILVPPVPPPPVLWSRLALATGIRSGADAATPGRTRFWQATTVAASLLAAGLAVAVFLPALRPQAVQGPYLAAALAPLNVVVPFLAEARPDGRIVVTRTGDTAAAPGRAFQLWEVKAGSPKPVSLGIMPAGR